MKTTPGRYSDSELVSQLKRGEEYALRELFFRYEEKLSLYIRKYISSKEQAEEIVQDIFIKLWEYRDNLEVDRPLHALLFTMAKHGIFNQLRAEMRNNTMKKAYTATVELNRNVTEEHLFYNEYLRLTGLAIEQLPPKRKSIFTMSRYEGKSYDEIAATLGISKDTVRLQMVKSLKFIREFMLHHADLTTIILVVTVFRDVEKLF
jgi:RNA polymerase sigma-70 factor (ECF subfamily)